MGDPNIPAIAEVQQLTTALEEIIVPQMFDSWLTTPNESFDGLTPMELIDRGEIDRIWQMIDELRDGSPA